MTHASKWHSRVLRRAPIGVTDRSMRGFLRPRSRSSLVALVALALLCPFAAYARNAGIASTAFGAAGCNDCHSGGLAPEVMLSADDRTVLAEQSITLTVTVTTVNGAPG